MAIALAKTEQEAKRLEDFSSPGFSSQKFKKIPVPSNWAVLGYEEPVYRGFKENKASEAFIYINSRLLKAGMGSVYCFISAGCGHRQKSG